MRYLISTSCLGFIFLLTTICIAENFPYRDKYPEIEIIEQADLKSGYDNDDFIIIDVRSKVEFETIHISKAINIPYGHRNFTRDLNKLAQQQNLHKKIVLYDNGIDCIKPYIAARDGFDFASIPNIYVFDAGINSWAEAYPSATQFLGNKLRNPKEEFISKENFLKRNLHFDAFKKNASSSNAVVIDLRDPIQRSEKIPGLENALPIPVDKIVKNIINKGHMKDKQLFIFDQVGGRVKWVMYYLVDNGYTDFYFLNGGATTVLKTQDYRVTYAE